MSVSLCTSLILLSSAIDFLFLFVSASLSQVHTSSVQATHRNPLLMNHRFSGGRIWLAQLSQVPIADPIQFQPGDICCCSVTQSCPILCDPMDCSTPTGFPVLHYLPEFAETHVHWVSFVIQPSPPLSSSSPPLIFILPSIYPASRSFPVSQLSASGGESIRVSDTKSVLPIVKVDFFHDW